MGYNTYGIYNTYTSIVDSKRIGNVWQQLFLNMRQSVSSIRPWWGKVQFQSLQSLLSRFVQTVHAPWSNWAIEKKGQPDHMPFWPPAKETQISTEKNIELAYPWRMLWQNHAEFDGPGIIYFPTTYPWSPFEHSSLFRDIFYRISRGGQDGWDNIISTRTHEHVDI